MFETSARLVFEVLMSRSLYVEWYVTSTCSCYIDYVADCKKIGPCIDGMPMRLCVICVFLPRFSAERMPMAGSNTPASHLHECQPPVIPVLVTICGTLVQDVHNINIT